MVRLSLVRSWAVALVVLEAASQARASAPGGGRLTLGDARVDATTDKWFALWLELGGSERAWVSEVS